MIKKYKQFESLLNKLQGPTKEEMWKNYGFERTFDTLLDFINYLKDNSYTGRTSTGIIYFYDDKEIVTIDDNNRIIWVGEFLHKTCGRIFNIDKLDVLKYIFDKKEYTVLFDWDDDYSDEDDETEEE